MKNKAPSCSSCKYFKDAFDGTETTYRIKGYCSCKESNMNDCDVLDKDNFVCNKYEDIDGNTLIFVKKEDIDVMKVFSDEDSDFYNKSQLRHSSEIYNMVSQDCNYIEFNTLKIQ